MAFREKKEYSEVLLSCAGQRRLVMVCPVAFGEVGIRERVKSILNYKKPALWAITAAMAVLVILAVCFLTNPVKEYRIRITIPAGSTEPFCYSDEEISPRGNTVTFYAEEGLGDTEIILLPVEVREENAYDEPAYMTPGMPVKTAAEKGAWFKIGVNVQNPTDESRDVYISVKNVEVRIASLEKAEVSGPSSKQAADQEAAAQQEPSVQQEAVTQQGVSMQQEPSADVRVSNILTDNAWVTISGEDAVMLRDIFESGKWEEGTGDCLDNCLLVFDGAMLKYHSDCGTINDSVYDRHIRLSDENREDVNTILETYITLQGGVFMN